MPLVPIEQIKIASNRRKAKAQKVSELMESIEVNGLLNAITVDQNLNLVAGLHRLTACKQLGYTEIECNIVTYKDTEQAKLAEIDENVIRNELEPLERAELWLEREEILQSLGMRPKVGYNQFSLNSVKGNETVSTKPKTTLDLAKEVGYSERSFQIYIQIARDIAPEIKEQIKGTELSYRIRNLLSIARVGGKERTSAVKAEQLAKDAFAKGDKAESDRQSKIAQYYRMQQKEMQMQTLKNILAERETKSSNKKAEHEITQPQNTSNNDADNNNYKVEFGDRWLLDKHVVFCGDTSSRDFINLAPDNADLAIVIPSHTWGYDYLADKARVVAVLRSEGSIYNFCSRQRMPFQYELNVGGLYVGIFSQQSIPKPPAPINVENVEGIVNYLLHIYTSQNHPVIAPLIGNAEILIICERMKRICFIGDENPESVGRGMTRWEQRTGKQPRKMVQAVRS